MIYLSQLSGPVYLTSPKFHFLDKKNGTTQRPRELECDAVKAFNKNIFINILTGTTKKHYKDIEFHLEFMLAKNSNAGVYFMGRYEIQIFDSYDKKAWTLEH